MSVTRRFSSSPSRVRAFDRRLLPTPRLQEQGRPVAFFSRARAFADFFRLFLVIKVSRRACGRSMLVLYG